jgi:hypothetical protein
MKKIKLMVLILMLSALYMGKANAQGTTSAGLEICFTGATAKKVASDEQNLRNYMVEQQFKMYMMGQVRCEDTRALRTTLKNISNTSGLTAIAIGVAAPTGVGLGISAILGAASIGLDRLEFEVGLIKCADGKEIIGEKLKESICEVLSSEQPSFDCNPSLIKLLNIENIDLYCRLQGGTSI